MSYINLTEHFLSPFSLRTLELRFIADTFVDEIFDRKSRNSLGVSSNIYRAGNLFHILCVAGINYYLTLVVPNV